MWLLHMASTAIVTGDSHMTNPRVACGGHMTREVIEGKNFSKDQSFIPGRNISAVFLH